MIWPATLLTITAYGWYLLFSINLYAHFPSFGIGLVGLFFISLLPTWLGYYINNLLMGNRTLVLKLVLVNSFSFIVLVAASLAFEVVLPGMIPSIAIDTAPWVPYLVVIGWQVLSWIFGAYYFYNAEILSSEERSAGVKAVEVSFALTVPAVFLLVYQGMLPSILILLIVTWFASFTFTLAIEGKERTAGAAFRFDIYLFHVLIPIVVTIILFFIAFSEEALLLFEAAIKIYHAFLGIIGYLFDLLSSRPSDVEMPAPPPSPIPTGQMEQEAMRDMPIWLYLPFILLAVSLGVVLVYKLFVFLLQRVNRSTLPTTSFSFAYALKKAWRLLVAIIQDLGRQFYTVVIIIVKKIRKFLQKGLIFIKRYLPAKTPHEKIGKSYTAFLRWGRKNGFSQKIGETPLEYIERIRVTSKKAYAFPKEEIERLTHLYLLACYSQRRLAEEQGTESELLIRTIRSSWKKQKNNKVIRQGGKTL